MDLNNIFIISLVFSIRETIRVIYALDKEDAIKTIEQYYIEPEIGFIISYEEIKKMYDWAQIETNKFWIIEMKREGNINKFIDYMENNSNIEELKIKYMNKDCLFFDKLMILELAKKSEELLKSEQPLISENIAL